jgi:hypothetical protein
VVGIIIASALTGVKIQIKTEENAEIAGAKRRNNGKKARFQPCITAFPVLRDLCALCG